MTIDDKMEASVADTTDAATINHDEIDMKLIDDATPAGSASGEDGDSVANCAECGAFLEHVRPGKHQHPTCSHVASALQAEVAGLWENFRESVNETQDALIRAEAAEAEVARLREDATRYRWLRDDPPVTLCVRQRHDEKRDLFYQYIDGSQLDAAIDAAMGSANGQGDAADTTAGDAEPEGRG